MTNMNVEIVGGITIPRRMLKELEDSTDIVKTLKSLGFIKDTFIPAKNEREQRWYHPALIIGCTYIKNNNQITIIF